MNFLSKANNFLLRLPVQFYVVVALGYFFLINIFTPLCYDDYSYAFVWDGAHGGNLDGITDSENFSGRKRIDSFSDIIQSQCSHYMTWGGRIFGHGLAQFFIWIGKNYFDIANTIMLLVLVAVILKLADVSWKNSKLAVVWIFICLLIFGERFGETVIWMTWLTGACNYFWLTTLQLIFCLPFVKILRGEKINFALKIFLPFFGIIAGWGTEAGSAATIFLTATLIFLAWRKKFFQSWMAVSFLTLLAGFYLNISAPGNFSQLQYIQSVNPAAFTYSPEFFLQHFLHGFLPLCAINLFVLLPVFAYRCQKKHNFDLLSCQVSDLIIFAFSAAGFIIPLAMMFSPKFELRVTIVSMIFILPASAMAIAKLKNFPARVRNFLPTVAVIVCLIFATSRLAELFLLKIQLDEQEKFVLQHRADEIIKISQLKPVPKIILEIVGREESTIIYFGGVSLNPDYCINLMVAQYYGVKKIVATP